MNFYNSERAALIEHATSINLYITCICYIIENRINRSYCIELSYFDYDSNSNHDIRLTLREI